MIESLKNLDIDLFLYLNSKHTVAWDTFMYWISHKYTWIPLYAILLFLVFRKAGKNTWLVILAIALLILCSDQLSVLMKNTVERYRPCYNLALMGKVHTLNGHCGGLYGFVSSHAANSFGLASFLFLFFRETSKITGILLWVWAACVCYSRIYSGVHYPLDLSGGALLGIGLGTLFFSLYQRMSLKFYRPIAK